MTPKEYELLKGMGDCYRACHADFERTVEMVAGNRGLDPEDVKQILFSLKARHGSEADYRALRERLPGDFPI